MVNLGALSLKIRDEHSKRRGWNFSAWIQNFSAHIILVNNNLNKRFEEKKYKNSSSKIHIFFNESNEKYRSNWLYADLLW